MKKLIKVYYIGQGVLIECYILKALESGYYLMNCETFNSRPWGDPPYWEISGMLDKHNYHFYTSQEFIRFENNKETTKFRIKIINNFYAENYKNIMEDIKHLKNDLLFFKIDRNKKIKAIKSEMRL